MRKTAISKCDRKFEFYQMWLEEHGVQYEVLDYHKNNFEKIKECGSLILTGGNDISTEYSHLDGTDGTDYVPERDEFEAKLLDYALKNNFPILGICRGMQFINCRLNGTLINDIVTAGKSNHDKTGGRDSQHQITIETGTMLKEMTGRNSGTVNSSHHQGIKKPGDGLIVSAASNDGIAEAIEREDKNKPFLLGVQWHPERMEDKESPFSVNILKRFKDEME